MFNRADYSALLLAFKEAGYSFIQYSALDLEKKHQIILRHDIDFSLDYALRISNIEKELSIRSSFFFLTGSPFYNTADSCSIKLINTIADYHDIGLQADLSHDDEQVEIFKLLFPDSCDMYSIHRPGRRGVNGGHGATSAYCARYFLKIKYVSDSRCVFREGNPLESDWFKRGENVQMLIHPIWWMDDGLDAAMKLDNLIINIGGRLYNHVVNDFDILPKG